MMRFALFSFLVCVVCSGLEQHLAFDEASASSTYSMGNLDGSPAFNAQQALSGGSGYWCSSGSHSTGQVVTWTGVLNSRRTALGIKIDWAYSPGEVKVLISQDGSSFEEAKCWQPGSRGEVAYAESIMFDSPSTVKAVAISMRSPLSWGYFGINSVALLATPGPFMLVSGITSTVGEQCLVNTALGVALEPCIEAIATGDGREVLQFDSDGQVMGTDGQCVTLADGDTTAGGALRMEACSAETGASDGRTVFSATPAGQLKMPMLGNFCLTVVGDGAAARLVVQDCSEADDNIDARDKFFMMAVPEYDPSASSVARESATLLAAAGVHLGGILAELDAAMPSLSSCGFARSLVAARLSQSAGAAQDHGSRRMSGKTNRHADAASAAVASIASKLGVDTEGTGALIAKARSIISNISR